MSARVLAATGGREGIPALPLICAVAILVMLVYSPSIAGIVKLWSFSEYRHGALVLPISSYLLWRNREALAKARLAPWWPGLLLVGGLVVFWWLARLLGVQVAEQAAAVLLIPATVSTALGIALLRQALFPLLFLIAAVPMGDGLLPYLMVVTADISTALLRLTGVPVFREGQFLSLPGGNFEVADVCAGVNYLVSGLMISALFAYLTYRSNLKRGVFVGAAALSLILANGLRAFVVMYVASASEMRYLAGRDHVWFGWVLFGVVVIGLFLLGARWADEDEALDAGGSDGSTAGGSRASLPFALVLGLVLLAATAQRFQADLGSSWKMLLPVGAVLIWVLVRRFGRTPRAVPSTVAASSYGSARSALVVGGAVLLLTAGPILSPNGTGAAPTATARIELPSIAGCSTGSLVSLAEWQQGLPMPDLAGAATYSCSEGAVRIMVAGFRGAGPGKEVHLLMPTPWRNSPVTRRALRSSDGREIVLNELQLQGRIVWYWYRIGDRSALSPVAAKLLLAFETITSEDALSGLYLLETRAEPTPDLARHRLVEAATVLADVPLLYPGSSSGQTSLQEGTSASHGGTEH